MNNNVQNKKKEIKAACDKRYREMHKEKLAQKKREYYKNNKDKIQKKIKNNPKIKEARKNYYEKNKNKISLQRKQKRLANIDLARKIERDRKAKYKKIEKNKTKWLETTRKYVKNKLKTDPIYKLKYYYRNCLGRICKKKCFKKNTKTMDYLGCNWEDFKTHIELQFEDWMTWDNWGVYNPLGPRTWNIDHIKPLAHFDFTDQKNIQSAFNYKNCRPYCSKANLIEQHYR